MVKGFIDIVSALFGRQEGSGYTGPLVQDRCLVCGSSLLESELYDVYRICPACRFHYSITARQRVELLADAGTFKEKYRSVASLDPLSFSGKIAYRKRIFNDQRRTGLTEAAIVGQCRIDGTSVVLVFLDFSFLGGSMGCVVGEKVALACELAVKKGLPLVAVVTSGGVRLQEGAFSLMQMAKTANAVNRLHREGLPYIAVFANPTTGQAYASFANLADVLLAEPGALVGFAPLRALQEMAGEPLPVGSHTSESHLAHGMVDSVVDREALKPAIASLVQLLRPAATSVRLLRPGGRDATPEDALEAWEAVQRARHPERPTARDYISRVFSSFAEIHGDRYLSDDPAVVCGVADLSGCTVMVIGQQRLTTRDGNQGAYLGPSAFHKARRAMLMAARFGIPVVTLIDTAGPATTLEAEEGGLGHAIATTTATLADIEVPTVAIIIGEGGRESALAFSLADRILMMEGAIYSPMSPEAAASLMYRDDTRAADAARSLRLTAQDVREMHIVDTVVAEPPGGAHTDPDRAAYLLRRALVRAVARVQNVAHGKLLKRRYSKFRHVGVYTDHFQTTVAREVEALQGAVVERREARKRKKRPTKEAEGKVLQLPTAELSETEAEDSPPPEPRPAAE